MRFEWKIAYRFLRESKAQTLFILAGIAIGVAVQIFLSSLIVSLQNNLVEGTVGNSPHITFSAQSFDFGDIKKESGSSFIENNPKADGRTLNEWRELTLLLRESGRLTAVSPVVDANGFLISGNSNSPVLLRGIEPDEADKIYDISSRMANGDFSIQGNEALIGTELQADYNLKPGDFIKILLPDNTVETLLVKGVFDLQNQSVNKSWIFLRLDKAQKIIVKNDSVTQIESQVEQVFEADQIGAYFQERLENIEVQNWKDANASLLSALNSQGSSSLTIQVFVLLAILLGISSVLGISVVQKSKEIGILKAMGARNVSASRIFLLQGAALGFAGSLSGCLVGILLTMAFNRFAGAGFDIVIRPPSLAAIVLITTAASFVSAFVPSRNSKKLNPIEVIRNG